MEYRIIPNKRPGRFRNENGKIASFYCFFAFVSLKTMNFSFNSLLLAIMNKEGGAY